jgi:hypothetical protein
MPTAENYYSPSKLKGDVRKYLVSKGYMVNQASVDLIYDAIKEMYLARMLNHYDEKINFLDILLITRYINKPALRYNIVKGYQELTSPKFKFRFKLKHGVKSYFEAHKLQQSDIESFNEHKHDYAPTNYDVDNSLTNRLHKGNKSTN